VNSGRAVHSIVVLAIGVAVGACTAVTPPSAIRSSPSPSPSAVEAVASSAPTPTPTVTLESVVPASPAAVSNAPVAFLVIGTDPHPGEVGGYTFGRFSDSAPWLPATALDAINVASGAELRVELDERATIEAWAARIATAADVTADAVAGLSEGPGPAAAFNAPAAGDWVVSVTITYGGGLGSGAYFWHLIAQ
jgi:hypothetical protein